MINVIKSSKEIEEIIAAERPASSEAKMSFCTYKSSVSEEWNFRLSDCKLDIKPWKEECYER